MRVDKRQQLLDTAEQQFAERGFYGVSIAGIASEVGFTKQGLLHYFNSKEKLYGAILQRISDDLLDQQAKAKQASEEPSERLKQFFAGLAESNETIHDGLVYWCANCLIIMYGLRKLKTGTSGHSFKA